MTGTLLITGGGRGIGAATARLAAAAGYRVAVNYRARQDTAEALVAELTGGGGKAAAFGADVAEEAGVVALFDAVEKELGPLTGLVNSAGISPNKIRVVDFEAGTLERLMAVNVIGTMLCCREAQLARSYRRYAVWKCGIFCQGVPPPPWPSGGAKADLAAL